VKTKHKPGSTDGWRTIELGECCTIQRGKFAHRPRNAPQFYGGNVPFVQTGDVSNSGGYIRKYSQTLNQLGLSISRVFPRGTILMTIAANIGDCGILEFDSACPDSLIAITPMRDVDAGYLNYYLSTQKSKINYLAPQGAQKNINIGFLNSLPILVPSLPEQREITAILCDWDNAIGQTQKLIEKKNQLKLWLMAQLLTGKKRFQQFAHRDWQRMRISTFADCKVRMKTKPNMPFTALGIRSHGKGTFLKPDFDPAKIEMTELFEVKEKDLILNITFAWEGAIAIAGTTDDGALVSHRFPTYEFKEDLAIPEFFRHVIVQKWFVYKLGLISPGGAGRNRVLSKKDFGKLEVFMPSVEEQRQIASVLNACDKEVELLKKQLDAFKRQKLGLMQRLLAGGFA